MFTVVTTALLILAPNFPTPGEVTRQFHNELTDHLRIPGADADIAFDGYTNMRANIMDVYQVRSNLQFCMPREFDAAEPTTGIAISDVLLNDQRHAIGYLQEANDFYIGRMIELSPVAMNRTADVTTRVSTLCRMQWIYRSADLPGDRLPGFLDILGFADLDGFDSLNPFVTKHVNDIAPLLTQLEAAILLDRYESTDLMKDVRQSGLSGQAEPFKKALGKLVDRGFQAHELVRQVRSINIRVWQELGRDENALARTRVSVTMTKATFPYIPAVAETFRAAELAFERAVTKEQRKALSQVVSDFERTVIPALLAADVMYVATHPSAVRRAEYVKKIRVAFGMSEGSEEHAFDEMRRECQKKCAAVESLCQKWREQFEALNR